MSKETKYGLYINGQWQEPSGGQWIDVANPFTGEVWSQIARATSEDVDLAVAAAKNAFDSGAWPAMTATQRGALLRQIGDQIKTNADCLAELETRDNGKLIAEMRAQLQYIPEWFYYFGGLADKVEGMVFPTDKANMLSYARYEPYGVVAAITAWNSPLLLAAYKLAPALAAGNTVVLKPSEHASASTMEFANLLEAAGVPPGVINILSGYGHEIGDALTSHPDVAKITFTGSESTGKRIAAVAAKDLKQTTLELGGKSANIVFDDADQELAAVGAVTAFLSAGGQTCVAGSRLLVQNSIYDEFVEKVLSFAGSVKLGDPNSPNTDVGPIANETQYKKIISYFDIAKEDGADCVLGGHALHDPDLKDGWFVAPTVYTNVTNSMRIAQEEIFGPVLTVLRFETEEEAVQMANDSRYGLAAGLWTTDTARSIRVADQIKAGTIWVNTYRVVSFMTPFGGYKASGHGRENGAAAIKEYLQLKSYWISTSNEISNPFVIR